jgi:hypothetical protein
VEEWAPRDETFRFKKTLAISGRVVNRHGEPLSEAVLMACQDEHREYARPGIDGTFRLSGFAPGPVEVAAGPRGRKLVRSDTSLTIPAGSRDLRIVVDEGCSVAVLVVNAETGEQLSMRAGVAGRWLAESHVEPGERVTLAGLPPGPVAVLVEEGNWTEPGRVKLLTGIHPGRTPTEVDVELVEGHRVFGKVLLPEGVEEFSVRVSPPDCPPIRVWSRDSSFSQRGLPAGPYRARFRFKLNGEVRVVERELPTNFNGEVDLR